MMRELSLHVLDIVQNSLSAGASLVEIAIEEDIAADRLTICIADNGQGMTAEQVQMVSDPFYTTRTTRRVGLGVPLFRMAAELTGGTLTLESRLHHGTAVTAAFGHSHIDRAPLGDIDGTVVMLIRTNPDRDFRYRRALDGRSFTLDTRELRSALGEVPLSDPDVADWISGYLAEHTRELITPSAG